MDESERRAIIEAVARGELSPQEAAERLDAAEPAVPQAASTTAVVPGIDAVRVLTDFGDVRIYGDASVAGAIADGDHEASHDGSTLVIKTRWHDAGGWIFRERRTRILHHRDRDERVDIRMNPRLALDLRVRAGQVRVQGVEGPIKTDVQAGDVRIDGFREPIDIDVAAGEVRARGVLDHGESAIRCKAGHVRVDLERGSSVRVRARATMGQVDLDDESHAAVAGRTQERVVGTGAGTLDIETLVGQVELRSNA